MSDNGGTGRQLWLRSGVIVAACVAVVLQASPAAADVDSVAGSATGVSFTGDLGVIPPTPTVSLSADETSPPSALGPFTATTPSVTLPGGPFPFDIFTAGPLSVSTSAANLAADDDAGFVESRALVQNVVLGPSIATASSIASSCRADGNGVTGATVIQGGMLNGQPFPPTPNPAPNTVIPVPGIGTVVLNEQNGTSSLGNDGQRSARLTVIAVHARFDSGPGGILPTGETAEAIIGQVTCEATGSDTLPPTTTTPPTTSPPVVTTPPTVPRGSHPETGLDDALPLGLLALALGGVLRLAVPSGRTDPSPG